VRLSPGAISLTVLEMAEVVEVVAGVAGAVAARDKASAKSKIEGKRSSRRFASARSRTSSMAGFAHGPPATSSGSGAACRCTGAGCRQE